MKLLLIVCMLCNAVPPKAETTIMDFDGTLSECLRLSDQITAASLGPEGIARAVVVCGPASKESLLRVYAQDHQD